MVRNRSPPFENRRTAGRRLGEALRERDIVADIVLAIPRGGVPVARPVADALGAPLDIAVAKKIGAPNNPEFAIGAVAADGSVWLNTAVIERREIPRDYVASTRAEMAETARKKAQRYRSSEVSPGLTGKRVCLVDDGVATGATVRACIEQIRQADPERLVLAVPVGSPRAISELKALVDEVVCLEMPSDFRAVGQYYEQFEQVSDEEAMSSLADE
ncbi:phosphoribosyltransferase [Haloarcula sp. CBA1130]|uniref:phosphoribosyltransferase n=1 Tax=unclassified Haloarcula TaxID=2624677 RepID=UPI001243B00E|nr:MULTISPECIES: phosphoribosyltransferase family protein [unclassified Haloarcula]KAA9399378.1 phosphoribosyltransferase [Haloarcula sp. CBA1129]KAA9403893.1 phosphoribosyltransferase [Haloarcula sp. CBA1130]